LRFESQLRPRARLPVLLREQLIANEVIAMVELVKNSYDADANNVEVVLTDLEKPYEGQDV